MEDIKKKIAIEAIRMVAKHYNTTASKVAQSIKDGNEKVKNQVNFICVATLNNLLVESA